MGFALLLLPTSTRPKLMLLADSVTGVTPVPVKVAVCGVLAPSSLTLSKAVRVPRPLGVKVTLMAQVPPGARLLPQLLVVCLKSPLLLPLSVMLVMLSVTLWLLMRVMMCGALVEPNICPPKFGIPGERVVLPQRDT